jgi:hypothetical protein
MADPFCSNPKCKLHETRNEQANRSGLLEVLQFRSGFVNPSVPSRKEVFPRHLYRSPRGGAAFLCAVCSSAVQMIGKLDQAEAKAIVLYQAPHGHDCRPHGAVKCTCWKARFLAATEE